MITKKGLVFYYDWLDQLLKLSDKDFRQVITAMVRYHRDNEPPPQLSGMADMALGFIIPQMERMKEKGDNGKLGGRPRKDVAKEDSPCQETEKDTNNDINNEEIPEEEEKKLHYGEFMNVLLTEKEYEKLKEKFPFNYEKRIDDLSYYIQTKGAKYSSHYAVILSWDRNTKPTENNIPSTFDTDDFFESALKRSEEQAKKRRSG